MDNEKEKVVKELVKLLNKQMEENSEQPDQYVVGYYRVKDDKLVGYHLSTSCQITEDILEGKRYWGDNPYGQLETISKNLKYTLESSEEEPGFLGMGNATREQYFEGYRHGDLYLQAVYLSDETPKKPIVYTYLKNDE
jgi:hypothetical protein